MMENIIRHKRKSTCFNVFRNILIALSVFLQASKLKKSAEVSLVLPPAEKMVRL